MTVLAHGGTAGATAEIVFIVAPILVFAVLSGLAKRRRARDESEP